MTKTELRGERGTLGNARVRNLSSKGLGGVTDAHLEPGEAISILLRGVGSVSGHVAWVKGDKFGMEFDEMIDVDHVSMPDTDMLVAAEGFHVADRFQPSEDYKRPGFYHRGFHPKH
ncbi:PilZ domain-containing protein [Parasphingopyxis sp. GrpM-11]|uniref:PilZ domain-containing protein n=1 Tax=Parasphingopyxis marina TaxID=2761622 RepID=A0A842HU54_9SPHN|nr:PilZ domain-containing protein [Parasphingopyxis marina]